MLNSSQEAVLAQLFYAYNASYRHADDDVARAWYGWVFKNLNDCKENPLEGRYSLQLLYDWSSYRLSTIVAIPVILSLAIGTWYMMGQGDVVTAWTLALYIVTTAAGEFPNRRRHVFLLTARSAYCTDGDYWESEGHLGIVGIPFCEHWAYFGMIWYSGALGFSGKGHHFGLNIRNSNLIATSQALHPFIHENEPWPSSPGAWELI